MYLSAQGLPVTCEIVCPERFDKKLDMDTAGDVAIEVIDNRISYRHPRLSTILSRPTRPSATDKPPFIG